MLKSMRERQKDCIYAVDDGDKVLCNSMWRVNPECRGCIDNGMCMYTEGEKNE